MLRWLPALFCMGGKKLWYTSNRTMPLKAYYSHSAESFGKNAMFYWLNLGRVSNILILLNFSLFFVSELVSQQGYFFPIISIILLGVVELAILFPTKLVSRLWYYLIFLGIALLAAYFFVASILYWVKMSSI